jgi:transposase
MILVRDRANAYALAGRAAAPDALQVADRFHLRQNLSEALTILLHSRQGRQPTTAAPPEASLASTATTTPSGASQNMPPPTSRKRAVWEAIQQRRSLGESLRQIARAVGLDRRTGRKYWAAG